MSCDRVAILAERSALEPALRTVLTAALQRMRAEGRDTDLAVEVLLQAQISVLVGCVQQLVLAGPGRVVAGERVVDMMARGLGVARETMRDGEMLQ